MHDSPDTLELLGFNDRFRALFEPHAQEGLVPGRVMRADRGFVLVATADGPVRAEGAAHLRREAGAVADLPAAGDWVALRLPEAHEVALVEAVLPRASAFTRGDPGKSAAAQVLAANVDVVFILAPIVEAPNLRRIERELALAWDSGAVPVVVLSKADLSADPEGALLAVEAVALGVDVRLTSARTGEGVSELLAYAEGHRTIAFIGPSGAGKSTLVNALLGEDRQATQEVRVADGKGRHTTVTRELIPLPNGGVLIDTPGLRALAMTDATEGIEAAFPDIAELAEACRFRDCTHGDEPGCAVCAAVETGALTPGRLESYHKLQKESRAAAIRADARLAQAEKRRWATLHQSLKHHPKYRGK